MGVIFHPYYLGKKYKQNKTKYIKWKSITKNKNKQQQHTQIKKKL